MNSKKRILAAVLMLLLSSVVYAQLDVREVILEIPTYVTGPEDPNPPLFNDKVYPYPMQTNLGDKKEIVKYKAIELENRYIKVVILPDLGGKILAAFDKTNENFDFIYNNRVVKPGLVALRGAWLSGGIEWNFPTWGHTVNTFSPVNYRIVHNDNGSISVVVGTEEWVRRMKWQVSITLYENRSYFETKIRLFNSTLTHNNGYYWSNAATHAWDDTRAVFPPSDYTYLGKRRSPRPWPVNNGVDVSWYKNTLASSDFFCATPGNFNGSYNYEKDNGTVHFGVWHDTPGKKFWTWGYSPRGEMWEKLLTDEDGQYIEVQAGRLISQGDTWIFEPHMVEEWSEVWYAVKNMHGFVKADENFALNLERTDEGLLVTANSTRAFRDLEFILKADGNKLFSWKENINPNKGFRKEVISNSKAANYLFIINDREGKELISYSTVKPMLPKPELQPDLNLENKQTAETEFLKGYYAIKDWNETAALEHFKKSLELDPGFTQSLRWLGILNYKKGKFDKAEELFSKAISRNEDDYTSRYYRGLIRLEKGRGGEAEQDIYMAGRRAEYRQVAPYILAGVEIAKNNFGKARKLLQAAVDNNNNNAAAHSMLAAVYRHLNKRGEAIRHTRKALDLDPLCSLAILENILLDERNDLEYLRDNPEIYIEVASKYAQMNLKADALDILKIYKRRDNVVQHPMLYYFQAWLSSENPQEVENYLSKAFEVSPEYIFPFRLEFEPVLNFALGNSKSDWKAHYYLGNLLTSKGRWKEGMNHFLLAADLSPEYSVLYRNMAMIYRDKLFDYPAAEKYFAKAIAFSPDDYRLYSELDEMMKANGNTSGRDQLHDNAPDSIKTKQSYILTKACYYYDIGFYDQALQTLSTSSFMPWEANSNEPYLIYQLANIKKAFYLAGEGETSAAMAQIKQVKEFPPNLGTEKPNQPDFVREGYITALLLELCDDEENMKAELKRVTSLKDLNEPELLLFQGFALVKTGEEEKGRKIADLIIASLEAAPGFHKTTSARKLYLLALANSLKGEKEKADKLYAKLRANHPLFRYGDFAEVIRK